MDWVAIDFETATSSRDSACALGVAVASDGAVVETRSWLIRPPNNEYAFWNMRVHGITPEDTEDAPVFDELWDEMEPYLADRVLVAHNAGFDVSVLRGALDRARRPYPRADYVCTYRMAQAYFADVPDHKLPTVAGRCGVDLDRHHDAACDARAAAGIAIYLAESLGEPDLLALSERLGARSGHLGQRSPAAGERP